MDRTIRMTCFCTLLMMTLTLTVPVVHASSSDPDTFEPTTVTDEHTNEADSDSQITWADLPDGDPYIDVSTYSAEGLAALYDMTRGFINLALPMDTEYFFGKPFFFIQLIRHYKDHF